MSLFIKTINEGQAVPFGYMPMGISINMYRRYEVALFPFNILIKKWRNYQASFRLEEWEEQLIKKSDSLYKQAESKGYERGYQACQREIQDRYLEISAILRQDKEPTS